MIPALIVILVFAAVTLGTAWPLAMRLRLDSAERIVATVALSLLAVYLVGWTIYVAVLPPATFAALPLLAAAGLFAGRRTLPVALRDRDVQGLLGAQLLVTAWCVGWLSLVTSYSGGAWVADWFGHWQRVRFFLEQGPREIQFNGFDPLTSRPPFANVVIGAFLRLSRYDFAGYQLVMTLLGTLAFLPSALLAKRFGGMRAVPILAVFFMVSPLFVQNATFAWTKLPAAFFTLAALYFFLRAQDTDAPPASGALFGATLACAILVHYSAVPYALLFGAAWMALGWTRRREAPWRHAAASAMLAGGGVLLTWFGWTLAVYGFQGTFYTNTTVTDQAPTLTAQLGIIALNLRDTLVPHFLRGADLSAFAQSSSWGWWRDWWFLLYQINFVFAFGSAAWIAIAGALVRAWSTVESRARWFWSVFVAGAVVLGVGVHGGRDTYGLAHICLQPLVLLGLAFLASQWERLARGWRLLLVAGATVDLALGIVLQFGTESLLFDQWFAPGRPAMESLFSHSQFAIMNVRGKVQGGWLFFRDSLPEVAQPIIFVGLAAVLFLAIYRASRVTGS